MRVRVFLLASVLVVASACGDGDDSSGGGLRVGPLVDTGACGQLFAFGATEDDDWAITVEIPSSDIDEGSVSRSFDLAADDLRVEFVTGSSVTDPLCNDLIGGDYQLDERTALVAGQVQVDVVDGAVDVAFTDLRTADGEPVEVDGFQAVIGPGGG